MRTALAVSILLFTGCPSTPGDTDSDTTDPDTEAGVPCDFSEIAGTWEGSTGQGADQVLVIEATGVVGGSMGTNTLSTGDTLICVFDLECIQDEPNYRVANPVSRDPMGACLPADYVLSLTESGDLSVVFPDGEAPDYELSEGDSEDL